MAIMKAIHQLAVSAVMSALLIFAAAEADAQAAAGGGIVPIGSGGGGARIVPIVNGGQLQGGGIDGRQVGPGRHRFRGLGGVWIVEREVVRVVEREVVREVPAEPPPPPPPPRKPWVLGRSYASLPGGCMKLIEEGVSYYWCGGGEWYQQAGKQYRAVKREL